MRTDKEIARYLVIREDTFDNKEEFKSLIIAAKELESKGYNEYCLESDWLNKGATFNENEFVNGDLDGVAEYLDKRYEDDDYPVLYVEVESKNGIVAYEQSEITEQYYLMDKNCNDIFYDGFETLQTALDFINRHPELEVHHIDWCVLDEVECASISQFDITGRKLENVIKSEDNGNLKHYSVDFKVTGYKSVQVEASSQKEAEKLARELIDDVNFGELEEIDSEISDVDIDVDYVDIDLD